MSFDILRILIVDPSGDITSSVKSNFNNVYSSSNVRDAMLLAKQIEPDCIVCDYDIADNFLDIKNGIDLFTAFDTGEKETAKILVSSSEEFDKIQKAINQAGIFKFIPKPFSNTDFADSINSAFEYIELLRENSGLVSRAAARKQYLLNLKSTLENKQKEQQEIMKDSDLKVRDVETEYEIINSLLTSIQSADSIEELEQIIVDQLYEPMGVDYVKIILHQEKLPEETPNIISTHLFCSGANLGYIKFGRRTKNGNVAVFSSSEVELLDRVSDIVAMCADKIMRFSKLKKLKDQWDSVFNSIGEPLVVVNRDFEIIQANRSFEKLTQLGEKNLLGNKCYSAVMGSDISSCCNGCNIAKTFETGKPTGSQVKFENRKKNYTTWAYPIFEGKEINCVVQFYKDVSEQTVYKEKILYSEKLAEIGIIAGSIAHEINNPIGGILAFLQMMMRETDKNSSLYEDLIEMEKAAKRCKQIADNLLHFSRQSRDEEVKDIEISSVFATLIPLVQLQIRHENININLNDNSHGASIRGVFNELVQAFLNIVNTSVELIQKKGGNGFINIDVNEDESNLIVSTYDNGSRFIEDEEFQNLALFVSKKIITGYNGKIDIGQRNDAEGNYFWVSLPMVVKENFS
ncbi:MAG: response regulator [Proteobacteria bacterium]|nr:response regulator [Pseudomonadota bacterium]